MGTLNNKDISHFLLLTDESLRFTISAIVQFMARKDNPRRPRNPFSRGKITLAYTPNDVSKLFRRNILHKYVWLSYKTARKNAGIKESSWYYQFWSKK